MTIENTSLRLPGLPATGTTDNAASRAESSAERFDDALLLPRPAAERAAKPSAIALPQALQRPVRAVARAAARAARDVAPVVPYLVAAGTLACLVRGVQGYPCTGYDADATQYFKNTNGTIFGYVRGWFSDCYDYSYACGTSCSSNNVCTTVYCTATASDEAPSHYVAKVAQAVAQCGYTLTSGIPADAAVRIANGLREKNLWASIFVNTLNLTDVTDAGVLCMHGIQ